MSIRIGEIHCPIVNQDYPINRCLFCGGKSYCHEHVTFNAYPKDARCPIVMPTRADGKNSPNKNKQRRGSDSSTASSSTTTSRRGSLEVEEWQFEDDTCYDWTPLPHHSMASMSYDVMTH
ncbi:Aste57867_8813 [Aphanomyces stellatus]|uniref:Aste57867_8813 protein n=1 Tax=Aphanomyces stellatus TaxID=120398 RepID=A0A485KL71_9STRA|nr:hypothetical protein As57867_008778 [Aphanomyces stellatus]VFT85699.1 Aste57867_8813 [Aphanomyces stellatus]